jgi:Double-GTPase 2
VSVQKLASVLDNVGVECTATDVLDLLWFARHITQDSTDAAGPTPHVSDRSDTGSVDGDAPRIADVRDAPAEELFLPRSRGEADERGGLAAQAVATPEAPALADKLGLSRSLRPLKRYRRSRHEYEMDEAATAQIIAQSGVWVPATRPKRVRWMDLAVVADTDESMVLWQQTIHELRLVLEDLGAFRDIRTWFLSSDVTGERLGITRMPHRSPTRSPRELIDPSGNRMVVVVSDCVGQRWQSAAMRDLLTHWAVAGPVAIVLPLPQRLWEYTNVDLKRVQLKAHEAGLPNNKIQCYRQPPAHRGDQPARPPVPVPIVELSRASANSWVRLVTASGDSPVDESAMLLSAPVTPTPDEPPVQRNFSAQELIERFELVASPSAMRLAECLAAAPVSISVMRLIQDAVLGASDQAAVAEVFLGGLLRALPATDGDHEAVQYDFAEGVRERLLTRLLREQALSVLMAVAHSIGERLERGREFMALIAGGGTDSDLRLDRDSLPFALVAERVLRRMGSDFRRSAMQLTAAIEASAPTLAPAASVIQTEPEAPPRTHDDQAGQQWRDFSNELARVDLPRVRSSRRSLVCPYCYHAFSPAEILFRCEGNTEAGYEPCVKTTDQVLQREMDLSRLLLPTFKPSGRGDQARCVYCRGPSRSQACPHCHSQLPANFRSTGSRLIALVGSSDSGKTAFMTVLIHELRRSIGDELMSSTMAADATTQDRFSRDYEKQLYEDGELFKSTRRGERNFIQPLVFRFVMPGHARFRGIRNKETLLSFADSAGEDLAAIEKVAHMARYLAAADAIIIMIDPLQLESVRHQISKPIALPKQLGSLYGPAGSVERITRLLAAVSKKDAIEVPVAVTLSKVDAILDILPADTSFAGPLPPRPEFDLTDSDIIQEEARAFLGRNGAEEIHRTLTRRFSRWRYFAVSALGAPPTSANTLSRRPITPNRIADPMLWILSEFDLLPQRWRP